MMILTLKTLITTPNILSEFFNLYLNFNKIVRAWKQILPSWYPHHKFINHIARINLLSLILNFKNQLSSPKSTKPTSFSNDKIFSPSEASKLEEQLLLLEDSLSSKGKGELPQPVLATTPKESHIAVVSSRSKALFLCPQTLQN